MPKIKLKPKSAEYADGRQNNAVTLCDMHGCSAHGDYKAPKHRGLNEYYYFCLEHVQEYNKAWNFFSGMSDDEVQDHVIKSLYGFRPTWKYGVNGHTEDILRGRAWEFQYGEDAESREEAHKRSSDNFRQRHESHSPEFQALAILGLEPPVELPDIKKRYKELAKKYHPDLNRGCAKSEELLKQINMSYTILKVAYEKFEDLPPRK
ncbi:MAG: J domain-containing protein [Alphaproteobacteria bacterium]